MRKREEKTENAYLERARKIMLTQHLAGRDIKDRRVLDAFGKVRREEFVPANYRSTAYEDRPADIGCGQTISQPYMVALMTQELTLAGSEDVLEIGTGCGYQTAILAELASRVFTIERIGELAERAEETLARLGYTNVVFHVGDGTGGWPEDRRFDRIIVTAGAPDVPQPLTDQLAEGGLLCIPVGNRHGQTLTVVQRRQGKLSKRTVCGCVFVKLIGEHGWKG